jgi:signal transduction histidine kinase
MTVYSIVHQMDGSIHVESTPGQGSTFTVLPPRSRTRKLLHRLRLRP